MKIANPPLSFPLSCHFRLSLVQSLIVLSLLFSLPTGAIETALATDWYVNPSGNDHHDGTRKKPWKTIKYACLQLQAGDTLWIAGGQYRDEGNVLVRYVDPETYEYLAINGSRKQVTTLRSDGRSRPRIHGNLDLRGSHMIVTGLEIIGDPASDLPGIGVYESHEIMIEDNIVRNHGGGGINFNHSDYVTAKHNVSYLNGNRNQNQHSGISCYQAIARTELNGDHRRHRYGVVFENNLCFLNRNLVPTAAGLITDGNGVIVDDHSYTQFNDIVDAATRGDGGPYSFSGTPQIDVDADGNRKPYPRRSLIRNNQCIANGGRGIQVYFANDVDVEDNYCLLNLLSPESITQLPRDEHGAPYFIRGQLMVTDSSQVRVKGNVAFSLRSEQAAAAEHFFDMELIGPDSPNDWSRNLFFNFSNPSKTVELFGAEDSSLLDNVWCWGHGLSSRGRSQRR